MMAEHYYDNNSLFHVKQEHRHEVDFRFYLTDGERIEIDTAVQEAVSYAFDFVKARMALQARSV